MSYDEDEFDALPNIYDGIDFDQVPQLCTQEREHNTSNSTHLNDNVFHDALQTPENAQRNNSCDTAVVQGEAHDDPGTSGVSESPSSVTPASSDTAAVASQETTRSAPSPGDSSSSYSFDELDDCALAELDAIELRFSQQTAEELELPEVAVASSSRLAAECLSPSESHPIVSSVSAATTSNSQNNPRPSNDSLAETPHSPPRKRHKRGTPASQSPPHKKCHPDDVCSADHDAQRTPVDFLKEDLPSKPSQKDKDNSGVMKVLEDFEDEMTCPICCDIFIFAHLGNPCGHSVCESCGRDWIARQAQPKQRPTCPVCRTELIRSAPLIPNFALDNAVERHLQALRENGADGWGLGGAKLAEYMRRKEQWKSIKPEARQARKRKSRRNQQ